MNDNLVDPKNSTCSISSVFKSEVPVHEAICILASLKYFIDLLRNTSITYVYANVEMANMNFKVLNKSDMLVSSIVIGAQNRMKCNI